MTLNMAFRYPGFIFHFCFFVFSLHVFQVKAQQSISGKVLDANTKQTIAFVNVFDEKNRQGTTCDIDGNFNYSYTSRPAKMRFSAVGYQTQFVTLTTGTNELTVFLKPAPQQFAEVTIVSGDNPAHRIIRNAAANRDKNNPGKSLSSYSCSIYNKFYITSDPGKQVSETGSKSELEKLTDKQHLFLREAVSERKFIRPGRNSEHVIATRVSGLQKTEFVLLSTQLQSFSFYTELILVFGKPYLNPLADGAVGRYAYQLEDTLFAGEDTVFIISFRPYSGKKFDGLKGTLAINSNGWALQNVSAEPAENNSSFSVKIEQNYQLLNGKWFPVQLHTDWYNNLGSVRDSVSGKKGKSPTRMKAVSRSYITKVSLNPALQKKDVGINEITIGTDAARTADSLLLLYRTDTLSQKEQFTYQQIDSLGKAEHFDKRMAFLSVLATGKYPLGYLDFDMVHLINYNKFESFRLGAGLHTSRKLAKWFSAGGYGCYGFRDKTFKYGADVQFFLHKKSDMRLKFAWSHDILESGGVFFRLDDRPKDSEAYRRVFREKFDRNELYEASLRFRAFHHFTFEFFGSQQQRSATDDYQFGITSDNITILLNQFLVREAGVSVRFAFREKFIEMLGFRASEGTTWPVFYLDVVKGIDSDIVDPDYLKFNAKMAYQVKTKYIGTPAITIHAGFIKGNLPYSLLYAGRGSLGKYSVSARNTFETMLPNEFLSDRYVALFYAHSYALRISKKFKPIIVARTSAGWGTLGNPQNHYNLPFKTLEKGFYESGLELNNLIRSGLTGIGVAAFCRYGPYAGPSFKTNAAVKLSVNLSF